MNKIQAKKLLRLADFLDKKVSRKTGKQGQAKFNMGHFFHKSPDCKAERPGLGTVSCGTSACALGWATALWPKDLRIRIENEPHVCHVWCPKPCLWRDMPLVGTVILKGRKKGEEEEDFAAAQAFFGLTKGESYKLFGGFRRTAKREAEIIRKFVKKSGVLNGR